MRSRAPAAPPAASGIVTTTASARVRDDRVRELPSRPDTTRTPWIRRPRRRGSSSRKPTTRSFGVSRSSRSRLRPLRPAPTISTRRWSPRPAIPETSADERALAEAGAADEQRAQERVDDEDRGREVAEVARRVDHGVGDRLRDDDGGEHERRVARTRVAPDRAVEPERDEGEEADGEEDRQRDDEEVPLVDRAVPVDDDEVGGVEGRRHERAVDDDLDEPAPVHAERCSRPRRPPAGRRRGSCANWSSSAKLSSTPTAVIRPLSSTM